MIKLTRHILPVLLVVSLIAGSCAGRKNKAASNDLIPENDLISILKDVYLTDGLLSLPDINRIYQANTDSLSAYSDVVESHGYKLDQMNRTIRYYFVKKPKKLIKIYDKVLGLISEMDSRIEKEAPVFASEPGNFWSGKSSYSFPDPSGKSNAFFDYPVPVSGIYVMKFTLTVYPDDQAVKPRIGIFIYNPDSTGYTNRKYFHSVGFIKDGRPHTYRSTVIIRNTGNRHSIKGWFIENENIKPPAEDHMRVENIKLSRNPVE